MGAGDAEFLSLRCKVNLSNKVMFEIERSQSFKK